MIYIGTTPARAGGSCIMYSSRDDVKRGEGGAAAILLFLNG